MIKIAVDAMGSDNGSSIVVEGIKKYLSNHNDVEFYVCGKKEELSELEGLVTIVDARDVMAMEDGALTILRKKETSMNKAVELCADNTCDGVISCGSTGAFLTLSTLKVKLIKGVKRAALGTFMPTLKRDKSVLILDLGANNENTGDQIAQFAEMGHCVYSSFFDKKDTSVYLLSNGSEDKKGCPEGKEAFKILKEKEYDWFKGNLESKFVLDGNADVVATGGYAGNIMLKSIEGTALMMASMLKDAFKRNVLTKLGYVFASSGIKDFKQRMSLAKGGGAVLIGCNKVCVKAHGNSTTEGFLNGLEFAIKMVKSNFIADLVKKYESE